MDRYRNPDSDGRFYNGNDMAKLGCQECLGCSDCCHNMGDSIVLDPYDAYQLQVEGHMTMAELLEKKQVELGVYGGMILPLVSFGA